MSLHTVELVDRNDQKLPEPKFDQQEAIGRMMASTSVYPFTHVKDEPAVGEVVEDDDDSYDPPNLDLLASLRADHQAFTEKFNQAAHEAAKPAPAAVKPSVEDIDDS
jgi:hypothetical protein